MKTKEGEKVLTFEMLEDWHRCRFSFLLRRLGKRGKISLQERVARTVGKAVENAISADTDEEREAAIDDLVRRLPAAERADALKKVDELVARADELYDDTSDSDQQVQLEWTDPVTGWKLVAKPDEVKFVQEGDRGIKQIIDDKTSWRLTSRHKRNIFFFGLVASLSDEEEDKAARARGEKPYRWPLQLVVRLLGTPPATDEDGDPVTPPDPEPKFWYSRSRQQEKLDEIRRVIREIDAALTALRNEEETLKDTVPEAKLLQLFPAKESWACDRCRYQCTDCPLFRGRLASNDPDANLPKTA